MKNIDVANKLKENFKSQLTITTQEIKEVMTILLPNLSESTLSWRLNQIKAENLIHQIGRGLYSFEFKPEYRPEISLKTKRTYNRVKALCKSELCVWDTQMLNEIMGSNISKHWMFLAIIKDELEPLFDEMLSFSKQVYLQPEEEIVRRYILPLEDVIVLVPLVSESPLCQGSDYTSPTIEGLLVNAWLKSALFLKPIGFEVEVLFKKAFEKYNINQSKLLRYAARRDKREEIVDFINSILDSPLNEGNS